LTKFKTKTLLLLAVIFGGATTQATASPLLDGWAFTIDSELSDSIQDVTKTYTSFDPALNSHINGSYTLLNGSQVTVSSSLFDGGSINWSSGDYQTAGGTGTGQITFSITGTPGTSYGVTLWLDHRLEESDPVIGRYFETAAANGAAPSNVEYGIDEAGYGDFNGYQGQLYYDVIGGLALSNIDGANLPTDIAMALRVTAFLPSSGAATFSFFTKYWDGITGSAPGLPGFYLEQNATNGAPGALYYYASVTDGGDVQATPEPGTWVLMAGGGLLICFSRLGARKARSEAK
jgi:hypothetical protein